MHTEDGRIISRCLNGEPEAFGILIDKYKAGIYAYVYAKLRNFHDAQDVTQKVFIEAYRGLQKLKHWESFAFWLNGIAFRCCKNWTRSQLQRVDREFIDDQNPTALEKPSIDSYHDNEMDESLREALDSLPDTYREVLTLYYFVGMDSVEIAKSLGVSPTAIRQRLSRAREQLKEDMIAMMTETFKEHKLQASFTFRVVEAIKRIKINPVSTTKGLPWGLSLATGIIIAVMSINPALVNFDNVGAPIFAPLPSEAKVLKVGEIPVDTVKISNISILSSMMGKGKGGELKPDMQNAFFMAPQGEGGTWTKKADMPTARDTLCTCVVNGKIYAIGGRTDDGQGNPVILKTVEEYDPVKDNWTKKADMLTARCFLSTSVVDGRIYAIGGFSQYVGNSLSTVEVYNPITDTWAKCSDMPTKRGLLSTSVVNGKVYAIGGNDIVMGVSLSTVEEYDPVKDSWTKKSDMLTARCALTTSVVNDKIYAMGGMPENVLWAVCNPLSTVESYNPATDTWAKKADMPTERIGHRSSVVNGKIFVIGGSLDHSSYTSKVVEIYDPVADTWTKGTDMLTASTCLSTSVVNGKIYAIGGYAIGSLLSSVEEYTPEGWPFAVSPQGKLPKTWGNIKSR